MIKMLDRVLLLSLIFIIPDNTNSNSSKQIMYINLGGITFLQIIQTNWVQLITGSSSPAL